MAPINDLSGLDVDEVSIVKRGAIRRVFSLFKADDDGSVELEKATVAALGTPLRREAAVVETLKAEGLSGAKLEAAIARDRLDAFVKAADDGSAASDEDMEGSATSSEADQDGDADDGFEKGVMPNSVMDMGRAPGSYDEQWDDEMDDDAMPDADEMAKEDATLAFLLKQAGLPIAKKDYNAADRRRMAAEGHALSDGSYPIANAEDLKNAAILAQSGHGNVSAAKRLIARRAKELGVKNPLAKSGELASGSNDDKERSMGDSPGAPVLKEDGSWDLSGVEPSHRGFFDSVLKSLDDQRQEAESLRAEVKKAEEKRAELEDKLVEKELIQKAEGEFSHVAKSDELVPVLKAARESLDAEAYSKLEDILKSASAKIETGELFKELGVSGEKYLAEAKTAAAIVKATGGDAWDKIEAGAAALIEKSSEGLSREQAVDRFLKTAEGKELYAEYQAQRPVVAV